MKRRKIALAMAMAMVLSSVPAETLTVRAEDFQDGFVSGSEETEAEGFAGDVAGTAELQENLSQDAGTEFVSGELEEGVAEGTNGAEEEIPGDDENDDFSWGFDPQMESEVNIRVGETATLKVKMVGNTENLTYSWEKYNEDTESFETIEGADSDSLEVAPEKTACWYYCYVTGPEGTKSCNFVVRGITDLAFADKRNDDDWVELSPYIGGEASMDATATAVDGVALTYQWWYLEEHEDADAGGWVSDWKEIEDSNVPVYTVKVTDKNESFQCTVTDDYGNTLERYFNLEPVSAIEIENNSWYEIDVNPGDSAKLAVSAKSKVEGVELSYQWQIRQENDENGEWIDIDGANSAEYVIENVGKTADYRCWVSTPYESENVRFGIYVKSGLTVEESDKSTVVKVEIGGTAALPVNASTAYGTLSYTWKFESQTGETTPLEYTGNTYVIENAEKSGFYICAVSDGYNTIYKLFNVFVNSGFEILTKEEEQTIRTDFGMPVVLHVEARSNMNLQYQWYKEENDGESTHINRIEGAESADYEVVLDQNKEEKEASYYCRITDGYNTNDVWFSVQLDTGFTASGPAVIWVNAGEQAELKVDASTKEVYGPVKYYWYHYNKADELWESPGESTDAVLVTMPVTEYENYYCMVSDKYTSKRVYMTAVANEYKNQIALDFESAKNFAAGEENTAIIVTPEGKMYFQFVPEKSGSWEFYSAGGYDTVAALYDENRKMLEEDDDSGDNENFKIRYNLAAGKKYYLECGIFATDMTGQYIVKGELKEKEEEHQWDAGTVVKRPTCTETGRKVYTCIGCGATREEEIQKLAHNMVVKIDKEPTCGAAGSQHKECSVCGLKEAATEIPATGNHSYGEYVVTKEATAVAEGTKVRTCSVCGATESAVVEKIPGTIKTVAAKVPLQVKKSIALDKLVTGFAVGDSIDTAACTSSKTSVAVIEKGAVKAKKAGTTVVTIKLASGVSAAVTVNVQKKAVATSAISISKTLKLTAGDKQTLAPVISPITTADKVSYSSSNSKIVSVTKKGVVTAKKSGKATIKVVSGKKSVSIKVTVGKLAPTGMSGVPASKTLKKGKSFTIKAKLTPSAAEAKITYKSSNSKIVSVSKNGKVTGKKKGKATITVKAGSVTKTCVVTVK